MITLTWKRMVTSIAIISKFLVLIVVALALLEAYLWLIFYRKPRKKALGLIVYGLEVIDASMILAVLYMILLRAKTPPVRALEFGVIFFVLSLAVIYLLSIPRVSKLGLAYLLIAPAFVGVLFLILYPFGYEIYLAFTNAALRTMRHPSFGLQYGIANFRDVFTGTVAHKATFWQVLIRTILWTVINVFFHVTGGMALALLLNRPMKLRAVYRTLLIFPWAIPQTIAAMALRNEFNYMYGFFNVMLRRVGLSPIPWLQNPHWAFAAVVISNIWLGIPFMMVIILGGLQSISREYYEAAEIDGANAWHQFWNVTMPLLRPVLTPAVILGTVWTFNNINVIYLITQGGPQERTDILVTSLYKAAFSFYRYGFSAAFALVIFVFLLSFALIYLRLTGGMKAVYE